MKLMLCPNPNRSMAIDRVIVIGESEDKKHVRVLNVDALSRNPALLRSYGQSYMWATAFWNWIAAALMLGGVASSFFWRWWAFLPGLILGALVVQATRKSVADFAVEILRRDKRAYDDFNRRGLIWDAPAESLVGE
jgi:hypothetical protein